MSRPAASKDRGTELELEASLWIEPARPLARVAEVLALVVAGALGLTLAMWMNTELGLETGGGAIALLPLLGVGAYLHARNQREATREMVTTRLLVRPQRVVVAARPYRIASARHANGRVELRGALLDETLHLRLGAEQAARLAAVLEVPDWGLRTITARGPIASVPLLGRVARYGSPALAGVAAMALQTGTLRDSAVPAFALVLVVSLGLSALSWASRRLVIEDDALVIRWLGLRTRCAWSEVRAIELKYPALTVNAERSRRFELDKPWARWTSGAWRIGDLSGAKLRRIEHLEAVKRWLVAADGVRASSRR